MARFMFSWILNFVIKNGLDKIIAKKIIENGAKMDIILLRKYYYFFTSGATELKLSGKI